MASMNKHRVRQRIAGLYDLSQGAQGTSKSIKEYVKALEKQVDIHRESMGSASDFNRDIGSI